MHKQIKMAIRQQIFLLQFLSMQKYQVIEKIGQGAYGIVLKCKCNDPEATRRKPTPNNKYSDIVAMKQFKDSDQNQLVRRTTMREVKVLKMLDHPNIVQLKQAFRKRGFVYLIFQYVKHNLLQVLQKSPQGLDHELIRSLIYQLVKGLAYLHSLNIIHRDIKPENLLISEDNQLKICDFGFARVYKPTNKQQLTDYVATRWYRSPQLLVGSHYDRQMDMWAVGCIMGELIDGNPMFPGENQLDQLFLIQKCLGHLTSQQNQIFLKNPRFIGTKFPQIHNLQTIDKRYAGKFSSKGLNFLKSLLKINPNQRLTAQEALKHPYLQGLEQQQTIRRSSGISHIRNDSKNYDKQESHSPQIAHSSINERKKNSYQSTVYHQQQKQKLENNFYQIDNIFGGFKVQKLNIGKKKKQDNYITNKQQPAGYVSTNSTTTNATTNTSKSVGKSKMNTKVNQKQFTRRVSLDKVINRQAQIKTQTGFYNYGSNNIIPQRLDEDQQSAHQIQPQQYNRIYNIRSPKSRNNYRKQTNVNTEQIAEQQGDIWQSTGQLPFIAAFPHKGQNKLHHKQVVPNIIITNSTFNYRHGH